MINNTKISQLIIPSVSGSICIAKATRVNYVVISTNIKWFYDSQIIVMDDGERLVFKKPTIDYNGKIFTPRPTNRKIIGQKGSVCFTIKSDIPIKHYQISDESDEDTLFLYYANE